MAVTPEPSLSEKQALDQVKASMKMVSPPKSEKGSASALKSVLKLAESEARRKVSPKNGLRPSGKSKSPSHKTVAAREEATASRRRVESTSEESESDSEVLFENYNELCERMAKTMYYTNPLIPCTPRPSLPLTILAVDTFSKYARKDTLEFLDIDMAAEIGRNACVSPTALVFALVYLERLSLNNPSYLKTVKPSELFVVSLLVASKFVQDDGEDLGIFNDEWATSANMALKKVNQLELEFLTAIDWRVNIQKDEYQRTLENIERQLALYQGSKRGWFTYTELFTITDTYNAWNLIVPVIHERITEVVSAICIMYTTVFATLITSSVLAPYLLSVPRLLMASAGSNSASVGLTLSSCYQTMSPNSNSSILIPGTRVTPDNLDESGREGILPSMEDLENDTGTVNSAWQERINSALLQHRRYIETTSENGFSFKCESPDCSGQAMSDEALTGVVQRVLENLLKSTLTSNADPYLNCRGDAKIRSGSAGRLSNIPCRMHPAGNVNAPFSKLRHVQVY